MSDYSRELIRHVVRPGWVCVDGGANHGEMSRIMLDCGASRLICVESLRLFADSLRATLAGTPCEIYECAVGAPGQDKLQWFSEQDITNRVNAGVTNKPNDNPVCMTTLDAVLAGRRVNFIKLDVEGCERDALLGARITLETHIPVVLWETREEFDAARGEPLRKQSADFMVGLGYRLYKWENNGLARVSTPAEMGWDTLAMP